MSFSIDTSDAAPEHEPGANGASRLEGAELDAVLRREVALLRDRLRKRGAGLLRPSASAGDFVQEAFVGLLRVRPERRFEHPAALRAYLWKAAWRLLLRRSKRPLRDLATLPSQEQSASRSLGTESGIERREPALALRLALELLDPDDRSILELVYLRELGIPGAARELGIRADAANMRAVRSRRRLAALLADWAELIG